MSGTIIRVDQLEEAIRMQMGPDSIKVLVVTEG